VNVAALHPYTIGGSTIAAAAGIDPYCSPTALFLRMTGAISEPESNGHLRIGKALEPVIIDLLREDGYTVTRYPGYECPDAARPWLVGHPDALGASHDVYVIECKATGGWALRSWNGDEPPVTWQAQVQTYMHLTGTDRAVIAALIDGTTLRTVEVQRNDRAIAVLLEKAEAFYGYLCKGEPPPPDSWASTREALHELYREGTKGRQVRAGRAVRETVEEMRRLRASLDAHEAQYEERRRMIEATMGDAEVMVDQADNPLVKWTSSHGRRLDTKRLKAELPAIYERFSTETTTRRFTLA
jgi:predicted phage-related endonuclease